MPISKFIPVCSSSVRGGIVAVASVVGLVALSLSLLMLAFTAGPSSAASAVNLGTAKTFGVLAGSAVTNTGDSVISRDLGVSPDAAVSGFPPGLVLGTIHRADEVADQAQSDLTTAYNAVAAQPMTESISADLAGRRLTSGVYNSASSLGLSGELTLDAQGDPNAVFIFQAGSTLTTASGSRVTLVNGAQACNVFWQVGSSATLHPGSTFRGTVLALTSITAETGATVEGRLLARNGAVTLDNNTVSQSTCITPTTDGTTTDGSTTDGSTTDGSTTDGSTTEGSTTDGSGADGSGTDSSGTGGSGTDGARTDGSTTGGSTTDGSGTDGSTSDGSVRDVPTVTGQGQVTTIPKGAPDTGDGASVRASSLWMLSGGVLALGLAGAVLVGWRRTSPAK